MHIHRLGATFLRSNDCERDLAWAVIDTFLRLEREDKLLKWCAGIPRGVGAHCSVVLRHTTAEHIVAWVPKDTPTQFWVYKPLAPGQLRCYSGPYTIDPVG